MEKRLNLLLRERLMIQNLRLLPEQAKKLILKQYDNEIDLIVKGVRENDELEHDET